MKQYEILYILKPNQSQEAYAEVDARIDEWITKNKGKYPC